jgi:flagellar protein FliO/FliZ
MPPRRAPRIEPLPEEQISAPPTPELPPAPPRPQREVLTALADDLAAHAPPVAPPLSPMPPRSRPPAPPRMKPPEPRSEARPEPRPQPAQPTLEPAAVDQSLAEMAQRLEAALRKPKAADTRAPAAAAPEQPEQTDDAAASASPALAPRENRAAEAKPARADGKPKEGKALYDTLEQEMASLLGRPASKT